jgi:WD40 repeat protein
MLFDGNDGSASLVRRNETWATSIHEHDKVSYGVAWCDSLACSAGWDTHVICTDIQYPKFRSVTIDFGSPIPWIIGAAGHCYVAAANGGIYDIHRVETPLYEHNREPYRIAVSQDSQFVASGDWGGDVKIYDTSKAKMVATRDRAHDGLVTNVVWTSRHLITSGADGRIRLMTSSLEDVRTWYVEQAVRFLVASDDRICAGLEDGSVWIVSLRNNEEHRFNIGTTLTALAMSSDGHLIAAGTANGELLIINERYIPAAIRIEQGRITCAAFDSSSIIMCSPSGRILRLSIDGIFDSDPMMAM